MNCMRKNQQKNLKAWQCKQISGGVGGGGDVGGDPYNVAKSSIPQSSVNILTMERFKQ